jgi:NitT/TauT family transport system substrate-binding protein
MPSLGLVACLSFVLAACSGPGPASPTAGAPTSAPTSAATATVATSTSASSAGASGAAATPAAPPAAPLTTIAVSYPEGGAHLPLFYAVEKGIFARNGLNVELKGLGGGAPAATALQGGQVQIADITGSSIAALDAAGADLIVLSTLTPVYPYVLEASSDLKTPQDLKGKGIAVRAFGDATDVAARIALKQLGLEPNKDVSIVEVNSEGARMAAVQAGKICCTVAQPQDEIALEAQGFHQLFDLSTLGGKNAQGVIAVPRSYATSNKSTVQAFVDSLVQSIVAIKADRPGAIEVLKKQLKLDDDQVAGVLYDYFFGHNVVPSNPVVSADQFTDGIALLAESNDKLKEFTMDKYVDSSFLASSVSRGLDKTP